MGSIKLIRNSLQPTNLLQELNRQRKRNKLCEVRLVVDGSVFHAHQCVLAASSTFFYRLLTIERPELEDDIEVALRNVTALGMRDVLNYIYGEDICVSEDSVESLLRTALTLSVKDLTNDILKYMISILEPRNCLRMLRVDRRNSATRLYLAVKKFICGNLDAVSAQDAFYYLSACELEKIVSSEDVRVDSESHLYEIILTWVKLAVDLRLKHFPALFRHIRLQLIPQTYLIDNICKEEIIKGFSSCRDAVERALLYHLQPEKVPAQNKRPENSKEQGKMLIATKTQIIALHEDEISVESKFPRSAIEPSSLVDGERVVVCGGVTSGRVSAEVAEYDGEKWTSLPSMLYQRYGAGMASCHGKLYVFGGRLSGTWEAAQFTDKVETLDYEREEWRLVCSAPSKRSHMCCVVLDGAVYLLGGYVATENTNADDDTSNFIAQATSATDVYRPASNWWQEGPNMTKKRAKFCAQTFRQQIFVFGGDLMGTNTAEVFHQLDNFWTSITTPLPAAYGQVFCGNSQERVFLSSGFHEPMGMWSSSFNDQKLKWSPVGVKTRDKSAQTSKTSPLKSEQQQTKDEEDLIKTILNLQSKTTSKGDYKVISTGKPLKGEISCLEFETTTKNSLGPPKVSTLKISTAKKL